MGGKLPLNLDDLLRQRTVGGDRTEYKRGWNPDAIVKALCALANDFGNLGGGYVVIKQDGDPDGKAVFPRSASRTEPSTAASGNSSPAANSSSRPTSRG